MARKTAEVMAALKAGGAGVKVVLPGGGEAGAGPRSLDAVQLHALLAAFPGVAVEDCALVVDQHGKPITGQSAVVVVAMATEEEVDSSLF